MSPEALFALSNPCVTCGSSFVNDSESPGVFALSNPYVTLENSFVDGF